MKNALINLNWEMVHYTLNIMRDALIHLNESKMKANTSQIVLFSFAISDAVSNMFLQALDSLILSWSTFFIPLLLSLCFEWLCTGSYHLYPGSWWLYPGSWQLLSCSLWFYCDSCDLYSGSWPFSLFSITDSYIPFWSRLPWRESLLEMLLHLGRAPKQNI